MATLHQAVNPEIRMNIYIYIRSLWHDFHGFPLSFPLSSPFHQRDLVPYWSILVIPPGWASHGKRPLIQAMRRGTSGTFKILKDFQEGKGNWTQQRVGIYFSSKSVQEVWPLWCIVDAVWFAFQKILLNLAWKTVETNCQLHVKSVKHVGSIAINL